MRPKISLGEASQMLVVNKETLRNPMRFQQRIGRHDRYGQRHVARIFNLRVPDSWDTLA
jgi:hypothetical protein